MAYLEESTGLFPRVTRPLQGLEESTALFPNVTRPLGLEESTGYFPRVTRPLPGLGEIGFGLSKPTILIGAAAVGVAAFLFLRKKR